MTISEIERESKGIAWRYDRDRKERAMMLHQLPQLINIAILDGQKYPKLYELFPQLFEEEIIEQQEQENRIKTSYANFMNFARYHNNKDKEV